MTAEAVIRTLRHIWQVLRPLDVPMAVMGGLALAAWKHVRATRDVDLLVGVDANRVPLIRDTLEAAGLRAKSGGPATRIGDLIVLQAVYEPPDTYLDIQVDLLLGGGEYHRQALDRRVAGPFADIDVPIDVLACEDLILYKLLSGRMIDLADAAALLRLNKSSMDLGYLQQWVLKLRLQADWSRIEREAFPDEADR